MILRRLGSKKKLMPKLTPHFPQFEIWIEPFFGSGSAFFYLPNKPKYAIVNDLDSDVFNLFQVVMNQKEEFEKAFYMMPIHSDLLKYWNENKETDPIKKALRFIFLSNFTYLGAGNELKHGVSAGNKPIGNKLFVLEKIKKTFDLLFGVDIKNWDFRKFLTKLGFINDGRNDQAKTFIYADPPYLYTTSYENIWVEKDSIDLFNCLQETGCKWAMSEFDNSFILEQAKQRNLIVNIIGERQNLKNRRTEILITNYKNQPTLFDNI